MSHSIFILGMMMVAFLSAGLTTLSIWRMVCYIQAYKFDRDKYRSLFGVISLRLLIVLYLMGSFIIAGMSILTFGMI